MSARAQQVATVKPPARRQAAKSPAPAPARTKPAMRSRSRPGGGRYTQSPPVALRPAGARNNAATDATATAAKTPPHGGGEGMPRPPRHGRRAHDEIADEEGEEREHGEEVARPLGGGHRQRDDEDARPGEQAAPVSIRVGPPPSHGEGQDESPGQEPGEVREERQRPRVG